MSEATLVAVATGDGSAAERAHVRDCAHCAARWAALADDLGTLGRALLAEPPPSAVRTPRVRWLPVGAALAAAALLALIWRAPWRAASAPQPLRVAQVSGLARDVSAALFAPSRPAAVVQPASDGAYLQAALNGGWPCGGLGRYGIDCQNADPFAYYDR